MAKYIDAEWFESEMHNRTDACLKWIDEAKDEETKIRAEATFSAFVEVALTFKNAPTIDIGRHGHWINGYKRQSCSVCRCRGARSWNYCPNCGSQMDEVEE